MCFNVLFALGTVYSWDGVWFLKTCAGNLRGMLWMAQKECWKWREKRGMRCGEGEKEMAGRQGGFPAVCYFSFFRRDSCRDCFFPPWQLTAGEQHQYQTAGCENPTEEFFHESTECDVNDSGGNTPICRMCSVSVWWWMSRCFDKTDMYLMWFLFHFTLSFNGHYWSFFLKP